MRIGARIVKTALAVMVALYLGEWWVPGSGAIAGITAALSVQPSLQRSWQNILDLLQANVMGAVLAVAAALLFGTQPFVIALVVILVIALGLQLRLETTIPLALVAVIFIMDSPTDNFLETAAERLFLILIGVFSSIFVNLVFFPPQHETRLRQALHETTEAILVLLRVVMENDMKSKAFRARSKELEEKLSELNRLYGLFQEEGVPPWRHRYAKHRRLVLYKEMIEACRHAFDLLRAAERYVPDIAHRDPELARLMDNQFEAMAAYHEKILLKWTGVVRSHYPHEIPAHVHRGSRQLLYEAITRYQNTAAQGNGKAEQPLFLLLGMLLEYAERLDHVDRLIDSYLTHSHREKEPNRKIKNSLRPW